MKRTARRQRSVPGKPHPSQAPVRDRRLVLVDDAPLRNRAATECQKAMARLEKARAEWRRFEEKDRPAFGRWMAATFGALLTELRENARLIDEQEGLVEEVEMEMLWSNHQNSRKAYAAVMKRRENPEPEDDFENEAAPRGSAREPENNPANQPRNGRGSKTDPDDFDPFDELGADVPKEERKAMFDDFLESILGLDPEQMSKAEYSSMFARFESEIFGDEQEADPFQIHDEEAPSKSGDEHRIKEIYRILVRRLHPDMRADGSAQVSAIWHEVQEAYEARNLDRLETLLALTEMQDGANGGNASVSQMHGALEELKRALRAIQRSIQSAKRDPAWNFSQAANRPILEKRIRREMEQSLFQQRRALAELKRTLEEWSKPWHRPGKKAKKPRKPAVAAAAVSDPLQPELFPF